VERPIAAQQVQTKHTFKRYGIQSLISFITQHFAT